MASDLNAGSFRIAANAVILPTRTTATRMRGIADFADHKVGERSLSLGRYADCTPAWLELPLESAA
jgi:hypothetical protein